MILTPLQKLPINVSDSGNLIVAKGFKKLPNVQKSPNLVTLFSSAHKMTDIAVVSHGFNVFSVCSYTTTIIMFFNVLVSAVASMKFLNTITLVKAQVAIISCT